MQKRPQAACGHIMYGIWLATCAWIREYLTNILWFIRERMKSWEKQIYRQSISLLIQQCSHHFHSSHSYLLCITWSYLFWEGKLHLADNFTVLLSTKIIFFLPTYLWYENEIIMVFLHFPMTTKHWDWSVVVWRLCS